MASLNIKSLVAHIDDRKIFMRGSKIHILCVYKRDSTSVIQKYIYRDLTSLEGNVPWTGDLLAVYVFIYQTT